MMLFDRREIEIFSPLGTKSNNALLKNFIGNSTLHGRCVVSEKTASDDGPSTSLPRTPPEFTLHQ